MSKSTLDKIQIREKYHKLISGNLTPQQRGYEFEKLIFSILENENLEPRTSYKSVGEQIDGSFFFLGQTFLLEAKWVKDPLPASSIYSFKGKLDGKFHTSSGIFIAVNGFSEDVEDALKFGKSLNILLFDENDIPLIFNGDVSFSDVLKFKLREAGDTGSLKVPYKLKQKAQEIFERSPEIISESWTISEKNIPIEDFLIFVEGKSDISMIKQLVSPIKEQYSLSYKIEQLNGVNNIRELPSLLSIYGDFDKTKAIIVILDDDNETKKLESTINNVITQFENSSTPVRTLFLFIDRELKNKLTGSMIGVNALRKESVYEKLETFIKQVVEDYYDPVIDIPKEVLKSRLENLKWNYTESVIEGIDDMHDMPFVIESLESLIQYLESEIGLAFNAVMPVDWLKEHEFDYYDEIYQYLSDHYSEQIKQVGWDL